MTTTVACVRKRRRTRALAIVAAAAATFAIWSIAGPDLIVETGSGRTTVSPVAVVLVPIVAGLAAWGLLARLERSARRPATTWSRIAGAVLLVSLLGPIGSAVGAGTTIALVAMHLVTGAILIPLMAGSSAECRRPAP